MKTAATTAIDPKATLPQLAKAQLQWPWPRSLAGLAATVLSLLFLAWAIDLPRAAAGVAALARRPELIAAFLLTYSACFWLRSVAWSALLGRRLSTWHAFRILQLALALNHLLPVKAGEIARPLLAARRGATLPEALSTSAAARLLDFACLLLVAGTLHAFSATGLNGYGGLAVPAVAIASLFATGIWLRSSPDALPLPAALRQKMERFRQALVTVTPKQLALAAALTLPSWILEGSVLFIAAQAMGLDLPWQAAIAATAFAILFQAFQVTPGGLGVYETAMTASLALYGVSPTEGLTVATVAHSMKFAYSYATGAIFGLLEAKDAGWLRGIDALRGSADEIKGASKLEVVMARLWNVVNEGKPFTPLFVLAIFVILGLFRGSEPGYWGRAALATVLLVPLFVVFFRFDFPLKLRVALWVYLAFGIALFRSLDLVAVASVLSLYLGFTVVLWGTIYYHLRMGMPWTNFLRFWKLVLENPDPTSGNFLEQVPKTLLFVLLFAYLTSGLTAPKVLGVEAFIALIAISALLVHQRFATWAPPAPLTPTRTRNTAGRRHAKKFIAIVIDGCRADRFLEADTPFCSRLAAEGVVFTDMRTVYPARTTTCFSSMFTGAPPKVHGMRSNFVPSLGVKCDSIFSSFERQGLKARLVGIAHLIDAFGENNVKTVTATMKNDEIDLGLVARAKEVLKTEDPDLLVLQLLSVDQTGHARGSYNSEYLKKIETSDRIIEEFLAWCGSEGYLENATVMITADHGQGIGIGGHGHLSRTEVHVPCIFWGAGVPSGQVRNEPRSIMDMAPTISYFLGALPPEHAVGQVLLAPEAPLSDTQRPLAIVIPCLNEAQNLAALLARIPYAALPGVKIIAVDDGSTDGTAAVAERLGATVVRHERQRGLGAALRSGLEEARRINARAAVYLDADNEYDPREIPSLLAPIEAGTADYVLGSRFRGAITGMPLSRRLGNLGFSLLLSAASGHWISDGQTGFRAFGERALEVAEIIHDYNYAQVLTLDLLHKGMRFAEVPITYRRRQHGRSYIGVQYLWRVPVGMLREMLSE